MDLASRGKSCAPRQGGKWDESCLIAWKSASPHKGGGNKVASAYKWKDGEFFYYFSRVSYFRKSHLF